MPLPALFREGSLGVNWGINAIIAQYVNATHGGLPFLIYTLFDPERGLYVADARTGQALFEFPTDQGRYYEHDSFGGSLFILSYDDGDPLIPVQSWDLTSGELNWEVTIERSISSIELAVFTEGLLLLGHRYEPGPDNILFLLDPATGQILWERSLDLGCFVGASRIKLISGRFHALCDERVWFLDPGNGAVVTTLEADDLSFFYSFATANQIAFVVRDVWEDVWLEGHTNQVEKHYLEALDTRTYDISWSLQVAADVHTLVSYNGDVIYRSGNQVARLNGETGEIIWQTTVTGDVPLGFLLSDHWLLVGSGVGYLHLLNADTGELVWEQDIWATIEPRPVLVHPVAWLGDAIIVAVDTGHLSLGVNENSVWVRPSSTPTPIPTATPTATPLPPASPPTGTVIPPVPDEPEIWPAIITAFLNADPTNVTQLADLLAQWANPDPLPFIDSTFDLQTADLNNDGRSELLLLVAGPNLSDDGWAMVIEQDADGLYNLAWAKPASAPESLAVVDLNGDSGLDFVYGDQVFQVSQSYVTVVPVGWSGQAFVDLSHEPIASTNVHLDEVRIEDTTGDGLSEIIIRGGTYGSAGAGPDRTSTLTYTWSEDGYVLLSQVPDLPQEYYFFLVDGNQQLIAGEFETAIAIYESSLFSDDAIYDSYADHQRAFAEFQLMLAYLLLKDEEGAAVWANSGHYPEQFYSEVKEVFWNIYSESHDWVAAAEAARKRVRLAGFDRVQLVPWVGYANTPLSLEDILPCSECLQGSIGSQYR
jgi:outer membrane protein assembly factor BamB